MYIYTYMSHTHTHTCTRTHAPTRTHTHPHIPLFATCLQRTNKSYTNLGPTPRAQKDLGSRDQAAAALKEDERIVVALIVLSCFVEPAADVCLQ